MEQVTPANADQLIDLLGNALSEAVGHLDYCGWGGFFGTRSRRLR